MVAKHVTDMRLLRNILNEFRVFHARVLAGGKLGGLTSSGLFALVAYKNTHMKQVEAVGSDQVSWTCCTDARENHREWDGCRVGDARCAA